MDPIQCKLCGSSEYKFLSTKKTSSDTSDFKLAQCLNCGLCFVEPIPSREIQRSFYKSEVAVTPAHDIERFNRKINKFKQPIRKIILQVLKDYKFYPIRKNILLKFLLYPFGTLTLKNIIPYRGQGRILDVGCNNGLSLAILQSLGWNAYGVEPEPSLCNEAKKLGIEVFCGTLEETDFAPGYFDVIRFNQVFEHIDDPIETLRKSRRILNDNGRIYIEVPNQRSFSFYVFQEEFYGCPMHLHIFSPHTMSLLCKKANLRIRKVKIRCSSGFFLNIMQRKYNSPLFINWRLTELIFVKPFCFILQLLRLGDIFEVEISK